MWGNIKISPLNNLSYSRLFQDYTEEDEILTKTAFYFNVYGDIL